MIGVHAPDATIWVAAIAAIASVITGVLALQNKRSLSTRNGHSAGESLGRIEDQLVDHENRLDRIEVHAVEMLADIKEAVTVAALERAEVAHALELHHATFRHERRIEE